MSLYRKGHHTIIKKQRKRGAYILAYVGRRKNSKRHIIDRYAEYEDAKRDLAKYAGSHPKWTVHIYNYCWEVLD